MAEGRIQALISLKRRDKQLLQVITDCFLIFISISVVTFAIYPNTEQAYNSTYFLSVILLTFTSIVSFKIIGVYQSVIRYSLTSLFLFIFFGVVVSSIIFGIIFKVTDKENVYFATSSYCLLLLILQITSRVFARWLFLERPDGGRKNVAIYGTNIDSRRLCDAFVRDTNFKVICFIDDSKGLTGTRIKGKRIINHEVAVNFIKKHDCNSIFFSERPTSNKVKKQIIENFIPQGVQIYLVPKINLETTLDSSSFLFERLNIEELLGRNQTKPIKKLIEKNISGLTVLVTGAGGSIGSELCRQIIEANPALLILLDSAEHALYEIERELRSSKRNCQNTSLIESRLGLVQDEQLLSEIFSAYKVDTIFHTAAYKHVPLVESNVFPAIKNNVFATSTLIRLAMDHKVKNFTLISSDKAVRPTNIMGATKRVTELICQSAAQLDSNTNFTIVRFGNVIGSSGSVLPLFKEQIEKGGPVTVTHREIVRYFMAISEAAQLVIQASALSSKNGETFVLDMGKPIKILDLAEKIIRLNGLTPIYSDDKNHSKEGIQIQFTGLRPGEKMYEELFYGTQSKRTEHPDVLKTFESPISQSDINGIISMLKKGCDQRDLSLVLTTLSHKSVALNVSRTDQLDSSFTS